MSGEGAYFLANVRDHRHRTDGAADAAAEQQASDVTAGRCSVDRIVRAIISWVCMPLIVILALVVLFFTAELWARYCIHPNVGIVDVLSYLLQNSAKK